MINFKEERIKKIREIRFNKKLKSGLKRCPGHWINKGMKLRNNNCYENNGRCLICGGYKK